MAWTPGTAPSDRGCCQLGRHWNPGSPPKLHGSTGDEATDYTPGPYLMLCGLKGALPIVDGHADDYVGRFQVTLLQLEWS